ncbi:MAG: response regulator [Planctomycetaceae bacterium]|nr:response regulator [Planctomycetaceae bacterium]
MNQRAIILIVDDSAANLTLCKGLLNDEYDVRLAKSGKMALAALERLRPDLVLLDIEMPDVSGFEVMDAMSEKPEIKDIPVIFVTSHATEKLVVKAMEHGAVGYVVKPFQKDVLCTKINDALSATAHRSFTPTH